MTTPDNDFLGDTGKFPFHIVERAEFSNLKVLITFRSGGQLGGTAPNGAVHKDMIDDFLQNLPSDKVFIS